MKHLLAFMMVLSIALAVGYTMAGGTNQKWVIAVAGAVVLFAVLFST